MSAQFANRFKVRMKGVGGRALQAARRSERRCSPPTCETATTRPISCGAELLPIVQYLGQHGKIHQVHMRNIRGGLNSFYEVFPDEGDVDFSRVVRILRDTQFSGSICPDHLPIHPDDPGGYQAFAFSYGYIRALIQAVNSEV